MAATHHPLPLAFIQATLTSVLFYNNANKKNDKQLPVHEPCWLKKPDKIGNLASQNIRASARMAFTRPSDSLPNLDIIAVLCIVSTLVGYYPTCWFLHPVCGNSHKVVGLLVTCVWLT